MSVRAIQHEELFDTDAESLFAILCTPSAIRQWWGASQAIIIPSVNGKWVATWGENEDAPDYITAATISVYEPPNKLVLTDYQYVSKDGDLPFEAEFTTSFVVSPDPQGARLVVTQNGFPTAQEADGFYAGCQQGWADTFRGIRQFLEARK